MSPDSVRPMTAAPPAPAAGRPPLPAPAAAGLQQAYTAVLLLLVAVTIANAFFPHVWLAAGAGGLTVFLLIMTYLLPEWRLVPVLLVAAALGLFTWYGELPLARVLRRQDTVNSLVTLLVLVPFLGAFFQARRYVDAIGVLIARAPGGRAYALLTLSAHMVGSVLNIAAVPVLYEALGRTRRLSTPAGKRLFSQAVAHGYITSAYWSPNFATLTLALQLTGIRFTEVLPFGILMAILALSLNVARGWWSFRHLPVGDDAASAPDGQASQAGPEVALPPHLAARRRREFGLLSAAFLVSVVLADSWLDISILLLVPLLAVTFATACFLATGMGSRLAGELRRFVGRLSQRRSEVAVMLSAGLLAAAIAETPAGITFLTGFDTASATFGLGPTITIPLVITLLAFMGLPPLISVLFMASVLSQNLTSYPPLLTVLSLTTGIAVGHVSAPFATTSIMLSGTLGRSPAQIVRWNFGYGILLFLAMQLVAPWL